MKLSHFLLVAFAVMIASCNDRVEPMQEPPLEASTTSISGQAVTKVLRSGDGWVVMKETLQPQLYITQPVREISWMNADFVETSKYKPDELWSLIDFAVHPSGDVSTISLKLDMNDGADHVWHMKVQRFKKDGSVAETELSELPLSAPQLPVFPLSYDRAKLFAFGEDVYVVARKQHNIIEAHRLSFNNNTFQSDWHKLVEPAHYVGMYGIIGGGFDNFHQGDRYHYVYGGVDEQGNLYVAAPSTEDLLLNHDMEFGDDLLSQTDGEHYDFGVAVVTKFSSQGERLYAKLEGKSKMTRLLNMKVSNDRVYLIGRFKTGTEANSWDAWALAADASSGSEIYESKVDVKDGDMFWDLDVLPDGNAIAVGCTEYTQNPAGLSVSDSRKALAVKLDRYGKMVQQIELPQGPGDRGSEAMFIEILSTGNIIFAGVHNAPGTHAAVYCDGFVAIR